MREGLGIRVPAPGDQSWQTQYALNGYLMMDNRCNKQIPAAMWRKDCSRQTRGRRATEEATAVFLPADKTKVGGPKQRSLTLITGRMPVSFLRRRRFGKESEKRTSRKAPTEPIKKSPNVQSPHSLLLCLRKVQTREPFSQGATAIAFLRENAVSGIPSSQSRQIKEA